MAKLLENGNMVIPKPACSPDGIQGDTAEVITPGDPRYARNIPWLCAEEAAVARRHLAKGAEKRAQGRSKSRNRRTG